MISPATSGALVSVGVGVAIVAVGYLIKFREWTFLIAGYDRTSPVPPEVAADVVGATVLRVGIATVAFGLVLAAGAGGRWLTYVFVAVVSLALARVVYRLRAYAPEGDT